jgi:hypothetical protein
MIRFSVDFIYKNTRIIAVFFSKTIIQFVAVTSSEDLVLLSILKTLICALVEVLLCIFYELNLVGRRVVSGKAGTSM